jgi:hypothetical protein
MKMMFEQFLLKYDHELMNRTARRWFSWRSLIILDEPTFKEKQIVYRKEDKILNQIPNFLAQQPFPTPLTCPVTFVGPKQDLLAAAQKDAHAENGAVFICEVMRHYSLFQLQQHRHRHSSNPCILMNHAYSNPSESVVVSLNEHYVQEAPFPVSKYSLVKRCVAAHRV